MFPCVIGVVEVITSTVETIVCVWALESVDRDENPAAETARLHGFDGAILDSTADRWLRKARPFGEFRRGQK